MIARTLVTSVVWLVVAANAFADSDGYYCVGPGYFAYQFGFAAPSTTPHRLPVVSMSRRAGLGEPVTFDLPAFQVHGMRCGEREIQLAAFDAIYTVSLDSSERPAQIARAPLAARGQIPPELSGRQQNLGGWSRPASTLRAERTVLAKTGDGYEVVLEIVPRESGKCATSIMTRLVMLDTTGRVSREHLIFKGVAHRECGAH